MKPITVTKELRAAIEYYMTMKDVQRMAFSEYCESNTIDNKNSHESAVNAVSHGANQIAKIVENHFKAWDLTPEQEAYYNE